MDQSKHKCLLRESDKVRTFLNERFKQLNLTGAKITANGNSNGRKFNEQQLNRYRNHGNLVGGLSAADVIWLCERYDIELKVTAKKRRYQKGGHLDT